MTELPALAGSEGYAACDDDGGLYCQKRPSRAFLTVSGAGYPAPFLRAAARGNLAGQAAGGAPVIVKTPVLFAGVVG